ncbi:hypothetical protein GP475_01380 [Corynebacterium poyangense]|uniref:Uncharacterized protein n=1 Tax=Corynebacterium poyangense TaxID=2684405 RepID=A0A7H0SLK4_9CORY|nr:hypothetical protein [Corynebacterium poyangense]MBZ8177528.1 hypothetical protein [Corynebacterium poyangense]QNQ89429.1 hypothetical protein GP475_01380 [Corynebacterium poyangense]
MFKRTIAIALAFIGVVVGAGFASGQEMLQFFISFGKWGIAGAILSSLLMLIPAAAVLQLGSYFQARDHTTVFARICRPKALGWVLDLATLATLFCLGFIMFAGAGANLNQQFGLPTWVGAILLVAMTLVCGFLDVDKVATIIAAISPFIIIFICIAAVYAMFTTPWDIEHYDHVAVETVSSTLPHWTISALNYVGFNFIVGVSMAIVIGGANLDTRAAGFGGLLGGLLFALLLTLTCIALFLKVDKVGQDNVPMLTIVTEIHPWLGLAMSVVIYLMIFNTCISMFYALAKRLTTRFPEKFHHAYVLTVAVGFCLSFFGFKDLVAYVFPTLGYFGILLMGVMSWAWLRGRTRITEESARRERLRDLVRRKLDPRHSFSRHNAAEIRRIGDESNIDVKQLHDSMAAEIEAELIEDKNIDYEPQYIDKETGIAHP